MKILTWIKPSSDQIHLWNYFWAVKQLLDLQKDKNNLIYFMIADLHALTTIKEQHLDYKRAILNQAKIYLALWIDTNNVKLFRQHKIPAHTELNWILSCITNFNTLRRMHAFKDAYEKGNVDKVSAWLFNYPTLMAADILLYNVDAVPVWQDQKQHLEHAQELAKIFNSMFWEFFKVPKSLINERIAKIPWIDWRKMSKSYNNFIWILDDENTLFKKINQIKIEVTEFKNKNYDELTIFKLLKLFTNEKNYDKIKNDLLNNKINIKTVKEILFNKINEQLKPIRNKFNTILDKDIIDILEENEKKLNEEANKNIKNIYKLIKLD